MSDEQEEIDLWPGEEDDLGWPEDELEEPPEPDREEDEIPLPDEPPSREAEDIMREITGGLGALIDQEDFCIRFLRNHGFTVTPPDSGATFHVGKDAPETSKAIEPKIREGSLQAEMLHYYERLPEYGFTDDEMERQVKRTHQSVSACRNTLMRKGLVTDSGQRRKTISGNDAIVWVRTEVPAVRRWTA